MAHRSEPSARRPGGLRAGALAFFCAALLTSAPAAAQDSGMGDPVEGQSLFATKECVSCHAVRGAGGRIGPDLGRTSGKSSFFDIAAGMWNHSIDMEEKLRALRKVRPVFEGSEFRDLVAFIYFLNYFDEPGDPRVGGILFTEKHCIQCHRAEGQGGSAGPSLEGLPRGVSPLRVAQALWNHGPAMVRSIRRLGLDVPQFQGTEILDLFAYLRTQGQGRSIRQFQSAGDADQGKRVFAAKGCAQCHGVFGRKNQVASDLGRVEIEGSVTQIAGLMWNHWPSMAEAMQALDISVPVFSQDELADLLAYLFVSRYDGAPGNIANGRLQYREKGCAFCHGLDGEGTLGPPLSQVSGESKETILQLMWNHAPEMWIEMGSHQIPWPRFDSEQLSDLVAYMLMGWETEGADD